MSRISHILGLNWEERLSEVFEENIKPVNEIKSYLKKIIVEEIKGRKKKIIKPHAEILKMTFFYNTSTRLPVLLKIPENPEDAVYEENVLKLMLSNMGCDNIPRIYALLEGIGKKKVLVMESCTKVDFSDFGSNNLEAKLISYDHAIKRGQTEKVEKLKTTRPEMFRKIAETLANIVKSNYILLQRAGFDPSHESSKVEFEVEGERFCIPVKGRRYYRGRFLERIGWILDYLGVRPEEKEKCLEEGKELIFKRPSEKRKDIFDWTEFRPYTIVHGNLKAPNIIVTYDKKIKLIDWRRASIASHIVDQIFMYNPNPSKAIPDFEMEIIQNHYLNELIKEGLIQDLDLLMFKEALELRLFYEGIRRASDISMFMKRNSNRNLSRRERRYVKTFKEHLRKSGEILDRFIEKGYVDPRYLSLRDLREWLIKTPLGEYMFD